MIILILLPISVIALLFWAFFKRMSLRESIVFSIFIYLTFVYFATEILSLLESVSFNSLIWVYVIVLTLLTVVNFKVFKFPIKPIGDLVEKTKGYNLLILFSIALALVTLIIGLYFPIENYDSLSYHMPRVMHWAQNKNVEHYATADLRQISLAPLAEYAVLHFYVLTEVDFFSNLVQWLAFIGCIVAVSLVLKRLGFDKFTQCLGVFVTATIPMAILQSSTTQNDLVLTFFILFVILTIKSRLEINNELILVSVSAAMAILTKGTAFIYLLPLAVFYVYRLVENYLRLDKLRLLIASIIFILCIAPYTLRNYLTFGNPLGDVTSQVSNSNISFYNTMANLIRNASLQVIPPLPNSNTLVHKSVDFVFRLLHWDVTDPTNTFNELYSLPAPFHFHEDTVPGFFHFMLILVCLIDWRFWKSTISVRPLMIYSIFSFFLFALLLKFQIWGSRLLLPWFIISSPLCAVMLVRMGDWRYIVVLAMIGMSLCCIVLNANRPLVKVSTNSKYRELNANNIEFENNFELLHKSSSCDDYVNISTTTDNAPVVGFISLHNSSEYLVWKYLQSNFDMFELYHVCVGNISAKRTEQVIPDIIIRAK